MQIEEVLKPIKKEYRFFLVLHAIVLLILFFGVARMARAETISESEINRVPGGINQNTEISLNREEEVLIGSSTFDDLPAVPNQKSLELSTISDEDNLEDSRQIPRTPASNSLDEVFSTPELIEPPGSDFL
jgi:hypothetical protein